jgi:CubicO group peptidase (beta-lactamase class C family)
MSRIRTFMNAVGFGSVLCTAVVMGFAGPSTQSTVPNSQRQQLDDDRIVQDLRSSLNEVVAQDRFSGAVLLAKNGTILVEQAYGFADHAFNARNRLDTKFNLGSMGKMFTAVAILQLVEQNRLSLNDLLVKVVPDYPNAQIASRITIHQLMTHTSGLGDFFGKAFQDTPKDKFSTIAAHLPLFVDKPLLFEPGTKWSYSNAGFIVVGLVIEKVSGQSYYDYVREHIFKSAGMINTDNYFIDADIPNLALGYITAGAGATSSGPRRTNFYFLQRGASAGGGYSTVEDLLRFCRCVTESQAAEQGIHRFGNDGQSGNGTRRRQVRVRPGGTVPERRPDRRTRWRRAWNQQQFGYISQRRVRRGRNVQLRRRCPTDQ